MNRVIGLGNALIDILIKMENDSLLNQLHLPKGSMQLVDKEKSTEILALLKNQELSQISGGSASNTIHGLAQLGIETSFVGKVGNDDFGHFFQKDMEKSGIIPQLQRSKTESGRAIALISPDSERTFATYLGAAVELTPNDITPELFKGYNYLHIEGYLVQNHDLIRKAVSVAKSLEMKISLDLASYNVVDGNLEFLKEISKEYVDILFANEEEGKSFTGHSGSSALSAMAQLVDIAVYKQGKSGSLIQNGSKIYRASAIEANAVDTTGAGDLYASGFLFGLINNYPLDVCGAIGSLTSGKVVEVIGPKLNESVWVEVKKEISKLI